MFKQEGWKIKYQNSFDEVDSTTLIFKDVTQLPMITNRWQEKWLGLQIRAEYWIEIICRKYDISFDSNNISLAFIQFAYKEFIIKYYVLEKLQKNIDDDIDSLFIGNLLKELIVSRKTVHKIHLSRLRDFKRKFISKKNDIDKDEIVENIYDTLEILCLFPNSLINYFINFEQTFDRLPLEKEINTWLGQNIIWEKNNGYLINLIKNARETLVKGYMRYALRIARNQLDKGVEYNDLIQEGFVGLMKAACRYNHREDGKFVHYASMWIWQRIGRAIAYQSRNIRLPVYLHDKMIKLDEVYQFDLSIEENLINTIDVIEDNELLSKNDCNIIRIWLDNTISNIKLLPKPVYDNFSTIVSYLKPVISLDILIPQNIVNNITELRRDFLSENIYLYEILPNKKYKSPVGIVELKINHEILYKAISNLSLRERSILVLRYGLKHYKKHTLGEIGEIFNVTRERIRQIQSKVLLELRKYLPKKLFFSDLIINEESNPYFPCEILIYFEDQLIVNKLQDIYNDNVKYKTLDRMLEELPGGDIFGRESRVQPTRHEQLFDTMCELAVPAHYSDITEQLNDMKDEELEERYIYILLNKYDEKFILLGEGVFSLKKWEIERANEPEPILPFFSIPLPEITKKIDYFFDSLLVSHNLLNKTIRVDQFLENILTWFDVQQPQPQWIKQNVLNIYYLIGLIPYTFYDDDIILECCLPKLELNELRNLCISKFIKRLVAMPEFLWIFQRFQPIRSTTLGDKFINFHPFGLNDTINRLNILVGLGAAQKSKYGEYELTFLGEALTNKFKKKPNLLELEKDNKDYRDDDYFGLDIIDFDYL